MAHPIHTMKCIGCGAPVANITMPAHPYIGASPGCWAVYCDVLAREYGEFAYPEVHRLTVDAYSAQHPGTPSRQSIQSVATHLIGLFLAIELGLDSARVTRALRIALRSRGEFAWLDPPTFDGCLNVHDVGGAADLDDHNQRVIAWARSVWNAWSAHHETIRRWSPSQE